MAFRLPRPCLIVFDMDGTLIDVSESYRETAPLAATRYLELLGLAPPRLTGDIYDAFKLMGGFNDDWDLTAGILETLLAALPLALPLSGAACDDQPAAASLRPLGRQASLVTALRACAAPLQGSVIQPPAWEALIPAVAAAGGGLAALRALTGRGNAHLVQHTGEALTTDLVQRIFSELYLGDRLFAECYGVPARFCHGAGLIRREKLLISRRVLDSLATVAPLGIATGRTRFEAAQALESHALAGFFGAVATITDAEEARRSGLGDDAPSLLKPHPFLLHRAADTLDPPAEGKLPLPAVYVGDTPDDIEAARRANGSRRWHSVGLSRPDSPLRARQLALGADMVLEHPDQLMQLL
jgi:phosphoglycolate phosphatase-like HAD superfamily hydrolase